VAVHRVARGFDSTAEAYERGRPDYPREAVDALAAALGIGAGTTVVDLGAGTGKLTGALVAFAPEVVALEPQHRMLQALRRAVPAALAACSTAEALPVKSHWAEAVVVAQAFHWFDQERAVPEIRRILVPGGALGLVWNVRDESVDWVAELTRIAGAENSRGTRASLDRLPGFEPFEYRHWHTGQMLDRDTLLAHVSSRSTVATLSERQRASVLDEIAHLCDSHPALAGRDSFQLPYQTQAFRARLEPRG
jgi:SAM-dependent methyltransferase